MKILNYSVRSFLTVCCSTAVLLSTAAFGQMNPQEGMALKNHNFTSFTEHQPGADLSTWKKFNDPNDYDHPEFGKLVSDAPNDHCVEVLSKRTADRRYFVDVNDATVFYEQTAMGELSGLVNNEWITIDHTLRPLASGVYESNFTHEPTGFNTSEGRSYIRTPQGTVYFNNWQLLTVTNGLETPHGQADWSDYTAGDDGLYIRNVFPGIDAEMIVFRGAIKTNFILKQNLFGTFDKLVFRDRFDGMTDPSVQFTANGLSGEAAGELNVFSGATELLHVGEAVLFARNGPKELVQQGAYRLNGNAMDVMVPFNWINDNIGLYALVVDPTVTATATLAQASITGSRYNGSCNFTNSCDYNLTVPTPVNATITNVAWTFTYSANGSTCWLQDGGIKIGVGSCVSPATAGYYWFCNAIGGGTCAGTNQTIYTDVASCMPAPSCAAQNLVFTLKFYRSCWGGTGCGNACIGAASPWTMTITGKTLEYTNTTTPITLSATTVCTGGAITATTSGTGGVPGYTYNWSFSPTGTPSVGTGASASIVFPTAGSITLYSIVTDACGNQVTNSRVVTVTPGPTITVNSATICPGGSAVLTATGGTTYSWSPGTNLSATTGASVTANPAATTVYTVTGTTAGCSGTATATVTVNPTPVITVNSPTICAGGSATLTASGATSYTWSPATNLSATTGATVTANPPATTVYTVTGTALGCTGTATSTVTVTPNPVITVNSPTICAGTSATLTASGGTTYTWSPGTDLSATTGTSVTATPAATTVYTVTGTTAGCTGTATATVTVDPNPIVTVNSPTICAGGSATLTASGATTYTWSPGTDLSATTGATVTANPATTTVYTVTGTTAGCTGTATSTVTVNPNPVITVNSPTICAGGSATLTASGATTYTWSPGTDLSATTGATVTANPAATTVYTVTGTTLGCIGTGPSTVTVNANPVITVNSPTICAGASATLTASGGTTYAWSPATNLSATTGTSVTANPPATTVYTVTGTTLGCTGTATSTVTVNPNPVVTVNSPTICAGASATLTATGATTYTWSPATGLSATTGATVTANPSMTTVYTVTGTTTGCTGTATSTVTVNPNPVVTVNSPTICAGTSATLTASGATTYAWSPATGLSATTGASVTANPAATTVYTITGTTLGCTGTTTSTVTVSANPVIAVNSPTICAGASATLTASGGTTYAWSPATGLSATTGATVTANPATTTVYTVTGTTTGCTGTATSTVTVNPNPVVTVNSPTICAGASATLTATGAATYTWSPATGLSATTGATVTANPATTTVYTVTGTTTGCTGTATSTVTVNPNPVVTVNSATICNGASATLTATGATTYAWSPATGLSATTGASVTANPTTTTVYTVTGTTAGCTGTATSTVTVNPNPVVTVNSPSFCAGGSTTLTANGATTYSWSPATDLSATTGASVTANPPASTVYTVTGTTQGCIGTATSTVTVNPIPTVTAANNGPLCPGDQLNLTATGTAGAAYAWTGPNGFASALQNPSITSVTAASGGTYTVQIALNGCISSATTTLVMNPGLSSAINAAGPFCVNNGVVTLTAANPGGTWSGSGITDATLGTFDPATAAIGANSISYSLTGSCSGVSTATITVNTVPVVSFSANILTGCSPLAVTFTDNSTPAGQQAVWDFGDGSTSASAGTASHAFSGNGCYTVSLLLTDVNGCSAASTQPSMICVIPLPDASFTVANQQAPVTNPEFQFINQSTNAVAYLWSFGDGSNSLSLSPTHTYAEEAGNYDVVLIARNAAGCVDSTRLTVQVIEELIFYVPNTFTPNGDETNNTFEPVFTSGFDPFSFNLQIYNRWGEMVFETKNPDVGWDGTYNNELAQEGIYTWTVQFRAIDTDEKFSYAGHVFMAR